MKIAGIHFAPLFIPLHRRLETLSAFVVLALFTYLLPISLLLTVALMFTRFWWLMAIYIIWIIWDREAALFGGRQYKWFQSLKLFEHAKNYYPVSFTNGYGLPLQENKNYIVAVFPHGFFPTGSTLIFGADTPEKRKYFSNHIQHCVTLAANHFIPFYREIMQAFGLCSSDKKVLTKILQNKEKGRLLIIHVGGAKESQYEFDGKYHVVLKNRKGFIKLALETGTDLVPVFVFGESTLFKYIKFSEGSVIRRFQDWFKNATGVAFVFNHGRGFFQYTFGLIPFRRPLNLVSGPFIEVEKVENPTQEDIDKLHQKFVDTLLQIFEEYKYKFEKNPENVSLEIV